MGICTIAAIYIGTYEVSLKLFEVNSKKKMKEIDHVRIRINLGKDAFNEGRLGYELVDELSDILAEFQKIAKTYRVESCEVCAGAVLRVISNKLFVLDQIRQRTGFSVKVLSNSEHRFISYHSVASDENFEKMIQNSAAIVDVGGASVQITLFKKGHLVTTQHLEMGTMRLYSLLNNRAHGEASYEKQLEEYINKRLEVFRSLYLSDGVEYMIIIGDYSNDILKKLAKHQIEPNVVRAEKFVKYIAKLQKHNVEEISAQLNLSNDKDPLIEPSMALFKGMIHNLGADIVWAPGVNINDGIAYNFALYKKWLKLNHDFEQDIKDAAHGLSMHYNSYSSHIEALTGLSTQIFDAMKKVHGLGNRQRLLLEVAAILHDCGKYVSLNDSARCAYHIIMSSEIIGLSHLEREIVARTVLYNSIPLDEYEAISDKLDKESFLVVAKLSAILRVANALDQSHKQKFDKIQIALKTKELVITVQSFDDISLEQALFDSKTAYFENVYSIKPVLKEKRVYNY